MTHAYVERALPRQRFDMSSALPLEARQHIVAGSPYQSVRNLTAAAERGEIEIGVIVQFLKIVENGQDPRFAKTRPVTLRMREAIAAEPSIEPRTIIYRGLGEGKWTWDDVEIFERNAEALSAARKPAPRGVYLTRKRRTRPTLVRTSGMFVPKMSLDAICDQTLCDGAKACLALILSKAGKGKVLVTYTASLATQLGRTSRTIRNHFIQLEAAGLIKREPGKHPNTVKITIQPICRPEPFCEPLDITAYKLARRSANPAIRNMAETVALAAFHTHRDHFAPDDRRKGISAFNPESIKKGATAADGPQASMKDFSPTAPTTHSTLLQPTPRYSRTSSVRLSLTQSAIANAN